MGKGAKGLKGYRGGEGLMGKGDGKGVKAGGYSGWKGQRRGWWERGWERVGNGEVKKGYKGVCGERRNGNGKMG